MQREQESLHHSRREKWSHAGVRHEKGGSRTVLFLVAHALRRSQFSLSSDGIAYFLLHLFQLMGQDFHVAADLLVGYPGIYLGGFQIRMPQKTAYGLDGYTVREQHGGGVRMPGHMGQNPQSNHQQTSNNKT